MAIDAPVNDKDCDDLGPLPEIEELFPLPTAAELAAVRKVKAVFDTAQQWCETILRGDRPAPGAIEGLKKTANTFLVELYGDAPELKIP